MIEPDISLQRKGVLSLRELEELFHKKVEECVKKDRWVFEDSMWAESNCSEIIKKYGDGYIAIRNKKIIDYDIKDWELEYRLHTGIRIECVIMKIEDNKINYHTLYFPKPTLRLRGSAE